MPQADRHLHLAYSRPLRAGRRSGSRPAAVPVRGSRASTRTAWRLVAAVALAAVVAWTVLHPGALLLVMLLATVSLLAAFAVAGRRPVRGRRRRRGTVHTVAGSPPSGVGDRGGRGADPGAR